MNTQVLKAKLLDFLKEEEGLTTVEYAIAGALVAATVVTAFTNVGTGVSTTIANLAACLGQGDGTCPS